MDVRGDRIGDRGSGSRHDLLEQLDVYVSIGCEEIGLPPRRACPDALFGGPNSADPSAEQFSLVEIGVREVRAVKIGKTQFRFLALGEIQIRTLQLRSD